MRRAAIASFGGAALTIGTMLALQLPEVFSPASSAYTTGSTYTLSRVRPSQASFEVVDVHEHVLDEAQAFRLLRVMDALGIRLTCLMGTPLYTFSLNPRYGFEGFKEHNERLIRIRGDNPSRFCVFVAIDPAEPGNLSRLQDYVRRGANGLKLYLGHGGSTGHGPFHVMPLDDVRMQPIYAWAEFVQLPIMFHVNLVEYFDEFAKVMARFPKLRVCIPHLGLHKRTQKRLDRLGALLDRYPNLYTDVSFGWHLFHTEGFESLAKNPERSRAFATRYAHRLMFATDMVIEQSKDERYIRDTITSYFQLLETPAFRYFRRPERPMRGLDLPNDVVREIYERTPRRFLLLDEEGGLPDVRLDVASLRAEK